MNLTDSPFPAGSSIALYLRDSGGDEQELSIDQQLRVAIEWAVSNQLTVLHKFYDSGTGTSVKKRPEFLRMMRYFQHEVPERGIIIWRSNRFGRNMDDTLFYKADLRRRGYIVHSLMDAIPEGPAGKFYEFALAWKDEIFSEQLSEDVRRGLYDLVRMTGAIPGIPPRGFQRVPVNLGQRRSGEAHTGHRWEPDPNLISTIQRAFEMRARGSTLRTIQKETGLYKSANCWVTFFANPIYKGELHYGELTIPDYCAPIVSPQLWQAANLTGQLRRHVKTHQGQARRLGSSFLLSGLARCSKCGALLTGKVIKDWRYYACSRRMTHYDCDARQIPAEKLDEEVRRAVLDHILSIDNLMLIQARLALQYGTALEDVTARRSELIRRLATVTRSISNLLAAIRQHGPSDAIAKDLKSLETESAELHLRIDLLEKQLIPPPALTTASMTDIANQITTILQGDDIEQKRYYLKAFIQTISLHRDDDAIRGCIQYHPPFMVYS
jgi:DNA invertase Pin-like site-specific DNA recombinase